MAQMHYFCSDLWFDLVSAHSIIVSTDSYSWKKIGGTYGNAYGRFFFVLQITMNEKSPNVSDRVHPAIKFCPLR